MALIAERRFFYNIQREILHYGRASVDRNGSFANLASVSVGATAVPGQSDTRALFDNFAVNAAPPSVPDSGATVTLLGGLLLGFAAFRRKLARA